jgi:hypothetical protein
MRFHYGLGVGYVYSHRAGVLANPSSDVHPADQTGDENMESKQSLLENAHWWHAADSEADEEDKDHVGIEELIPFEQGYNESTEMLIDALDEMYTEYVFNYEN